MSHSKINIRPLEITDASQLATLATNKKAWDHLRDYIPYPYDEKDAEDFINLTKSEHRYSKLKP